MISIALDRLGNTVRYRVSWQDGEALLPRASFEALAGGTDRLVRRSGEKPGLRHIQPTTIPNRQIRDDLVQAGLIDGDGAFTDRGLTVRYVWAGGRG